MSTESQIIDELLAVIRDESYPAEFREEIKVLLLDIKEEIDRAILQFS